MRQARQFLQLYTAEAAAAAAAAAARQGEFSAQRTLQARVTRQEVCKNCLEGCGGGIATVVQAIEAKECQNLQHT